MQPRPLDLLSILTCDTQKFFHAASKKSPFDVFDGIGVDDLVDDVSKYCESVCFVIFGVSDKNFGRS